MTTKELKKKYDYWLAQEGKYKLAFYQAKKAYKLATGFSEKRQAKTRANEIRAKLREAQKQKSLLKKQLKWSLQAEGKKAKV